MALISSFTLAALSGCATRQTSDTPAGASSTPPATLLSAPPMAARKPHVVTSPHGDREDPWYWLRDDTRKDPEVLAYLEAENAWTAQWFAPLQPLKVKLFEEIKARIQQDDSSVPVLDDGYWYYVRYETGQQYPIVARRKASMDADEEILIDGNQRAAGHGFYQLGNWEISEDGRYLAMAEDMVGRRQYTVRIRDLHTGAWLDEVLENVEANLVWANDNATLFYVTKDPVTLLANAIHRHRLGTPVSADVEVYREADNTYYTSIYRTKSDRFLVIYLSSTQTSEARFVDANHPEQPFTVFLPRQRDHEYAIDHLGDHFYIYSNWKAPNFRILRAPLNAHAQQARWQDVVAHRTDTYIDGFELFADRLAIGERSGGLRKIRIKPMQGGEETFIAADEPTYMMALQPTPDLNSGKLRYSYNSLTTPATTYELDFATGERRILKREPVLGDFDPANYVSEFQFVPARDGARVPVSIVYHKNTPRDGSAPLFQLGYGSYGSSTDPRFSSSRLSLLDRGFIVALAHVRGGQEMGRQWYEDGKLLKKQNTFNDFVDVSDWLIAQRYTQADRLFARGGSAGGLLMGAIINQAPDRYRGVISDVPFVDVVTTMLDESIPLTTGEFDEWGNPKQKPYYDAMLAYSPYDQVKAQDYPALLVTTGLWDSQVQYFEPAKWVAKLRTLNTGTQPLLFKTNMSAGHGGRSGRFNALEEEAERFAFLLALAGIKD